MTVEKYVQSYVSKDGESPGLLNSARSTLRVPNLGAYRARWHEGQSAAWHIGLKAVSKLRNSALFALVANRMNR